MTLIPIPTTEPDVPTDDDCKVGVPVQASTVRAFLNGAAHLMGMRLRREAHNVVAYDISTDALEDQTPKADDGVVRTVWRASRRAVHVWCWVRFQATRGEDDNNQEIAVALYAVDDGVELDKGFRWTADHLDGDAGDGEDLPAFPLRDTHSGFATHDAFDQQTQPRLLNIPNGNAGELIELRTTATDARVVSVSLWEFAPAAMEQAL